MIDGIVNIAWVPHCRRFRVTTVAAAPSVATNGDSRESPGPNSEASLSRPSTGRVLAAGALALAVSTPVLDSVEPPIESMASPAPAVAPALVEPPPAVAVRTALQTSRSAVRRPVAWPAAVALQAARRSVLREAGKIRTGRRAVQARRAAEARAAARRAVRRAGTARPGAAVRPGAAHRSAHRRGPSRIRASIRMSPVIAYARSQIGKSYRHGADGPNAFDCSGLTKRAYARAGLRLPHSSSAQAARARRVSRAAARAGDLVVGSGHVGIYMGGGMMIDAGNSRVGVVYRRLYGGLHIERF